MTVTEVSYRAVKNHGNYETSTVEMRAVVNENEDPVGVLEKLETTVCEFLDIPMEEDPEEVRRPKV